jgi:DNA-directed RNA polymerase I, II, and III subunit RPABC2
MDEFQNDDYAGEEEFVEEAEADLELEEVADISEAQRSEAVDVAKLLRLHNEVWIPYEDQVFAQLNTAAPGVADTVKKVGFRDVSGLDDKHVTYPFLTNYERTKIVSFRASQISNGAKPYILVPEGVTDSYVIATMELDAKRLPFIMKRPLPDGTFETWRLSDLLVF